MSALSIFRPKHLGRLLLSDGLNIARDPMLVFAGILSLLPWLGLWYFRDAIDAAAVGAFGAAGFSRYLAPIAIVMPAFLVGWVTGFLLIEDRDEGTLQAIDVTPPGKGGFLLYRAVATAIVVAAIAYPATRTLLPEVDVVIALVIASLVAIEGVCAAVVLPAIARNKVEGLALTKLTNLGSIAPLLALVPSAWRYLGGILPPFWIGELAGLGGSRDLPLALAVVLAIAVHVVVAVALFRLLGSRSG